MTLREVKRTVSRLFDEEMGTWGRVRELVEKEEHSLEQSDASSSMAVHYIQWVARRAKALYDELGALRVGMDAYNDLINSRHVVVR